MIPKIIHLCWLSGDEYPDNIKKCLATWSEHLGDYEIRIWTYKDLVELNSKWAMQAFEVKKYAFAADFIRLYALYNHGGIYLDSDVYVYKSFNPLLKLPYFIGEDYMHHFEPAIIGAEKGNTWIKMCLDYYSEKEFIKDDGSFDTWALPAVFHSTLKEKMKFKKINDISEFVFEDRILNIFNMNFFNSKNHFDIVQTPTSYCSHMFASAWIDDKQTFKSSAKRWLHRLIPSKRVLLFIYKINYSLNKTVRSYRIDL